MAKKRKKHESVEKFIGLAERLQLAIRERMNQRLRGLELLLAALDMARNSLPVTYVPLPDGKRDEPFFVPGSNDDKLSEHILTMRLRLTNILEKDGYQVTTAKRGWKVSERQAGKTR